MAKVSLKKRKKNAIPAHVDRLYKAVANYVEKVGGQLVVIGGIQIQQWPNDGEYRFTIGIKCTGTKPKFAGDDGDGGGQT